MRLGRVLTQYRYAERLTVRQLAKNIGLSAPTLSRLENDGDMNGKTLAAILRWLLAEQRSKCAEESKA